MCEQSKFSKRNIFFTPYLSTLLRLLCPCRITGVEFTIFALTELSSELRVFDNEKFKFLMGESVSDISINDAIDVSSRCDVGLVLGNSIA